MTDSISYTVIRFLADKFRDIYNLGANIYIYEAGVVRISLNNFLLALIFMFIIIKSLINFVHYSYSGSINNNNKNKINRNQKSDLGES